jgi:periplasmic copper chaperone A
MSPNPSPTPPPRPPGRTGTARRLAGRVLVVGALTAAGVCAAAGTAFAHVVVDPHTAPQGGDAKVAFRTPNEEDSANTVRLQVSFPADHPIPSVLTEPIPGWTASVQKANLPKPIQTDDGQVTQAVSTITWSGGQIPPGQFQDFAVSLESLPSDTDRLVFKAVQTYSNGDVVRWIDVAAPGAPEPEHPAPTLTLTRSGADATTASDDAAAPSSGGGGGAGLVVGIIGLVVAVIALAVGVLAMRKRAGG